MMYARQRFAADTTSITIVMAGLGPATHVFVGRKQRRGCRPAPSLTVRRVGLRVLLRRGGGVEEDVALHADLLDQVELTLEEVDVLLLVLQDTAQQVA